LAGRGKAFVDFQNDVTADDTDLAVREGYSAAELLKRYTTLGMGTDQGKSSNVNGLGLLSEATGLPIAQVGTTVFRPPYTPVTLGALAGEFVGRDWRPTRRTPFHQWAERQGATFIESGLWLRAQCYPMPGEDVAAAANRETLAVRQGVGVCDVSTLGKIMLEGPDAPGFLNRVYANDFGSLPVGRTRYALLLREDGVVMDDGTVSRLTENRFFLTTTSAGAEHILEHLTYCAETIWPELDVQVGDVTEDFGALALAGPKTRTLAERLIEGLDLSNNAFPFLSAADAMACGVRILILRVSFSGELGYELYVPSRDAERLAQAVVEAGANLGLVPYGVEALGILRIEKGFVAGSEINGTATAAQLGFAKVVGISKPDFIGKALLDRAGLTDPVYRPRIIGLKAVDPKQAIIAGAHLFEPDADRVPANDLGYVTTATWSPTLERHIGLAFLTHASSRTGETIAACSSVHGVETLAEVCSPAFYDAEGRRARA
jgi:sarcosine oxidase subunit alpha